MAVTLTTVQPGDIISAERWNLLLTQITELETQVQQLSGTITTGTITVPNVFGLTLNQARDLLTRPSLQLTLGSVINTFGELVNTGLPASGSLRVINQVPIAGAKTIPGAGVNLVVAAVPAAVGTPTPTAPVITTVLPSPGPVGTQVEIRGQRFATLNTDNVVTFDNIRTSNPPLAGLSNTTSLFVNVPSGIPGAPTAAGQPNRTGVVVRVQTPGGSASFENFIVGPPPSDPLPTITETSPRPGIVGGALNITGQNFAPTAAGNRVRFDDNPTLDVTPTSATDVGGGLIRLAVTIPNGINGLTQIGGDRSDVPIIVFKTGQPIPATPQKFVVRITV